MSLTRSLASGSSSLKAHQAKFDVISNNLANANTLGYKSSRASFADQFSQTYKLGSAPSTNGSGGNGGTNPIQYGLGVRLGSVQQDMTQGVTEATNRPLDMALNGDGFFVFNDNGRQLYSRAGAVTKDVDGTLVDASSGNILQGYLPATDTNGLPLKDSKGYNIINKKLTNLVIPSDTVSQPKQTQVVQLKGNLDVAAATGSVAPTSINLFDLTGGTHDITLNFTKSAVPNEFTVTGIFEGKNVALSAGTVKFNTDGSLNTPTSIQLNAADLNAAIGSQIFDATTPKNISIELTGSNNLLSNSLTSKAGNSTLTVQSQDGYSSGTLTSVSVSDDGRIFGSFSNGRSEVLAQVAIAKFTNPEGLEKQGGNFFATSPNSGLANVGTAKETFPSTAIKGNSLEQSNVDMTNEFTEMISTQRAYEAASRTITVSDQLLQETNQLKR